MQVIVMCSLSVFGIAHFIAQELLGQGLVSAFCGGQQQVQGPRKV